MNESEKSCFTYFSCLNEIKELVDNHLNKVACQSNALNEGDEGYLSAILDIDIILNKYDIPNKEIKE